MCAPCTATALRARRWTLERLRGAHERARADLASALRRSEGAGTKENTPPGDVARDVERRRARADARRSRLAELRARVAVARDDAARRAAANAARAAALREAALRLKRRRAELFSVAGDFSFPERRRALALRAKAAEDAFAREACFALADLEALVPVAAERPDPETLLRGAFLRATRNGGKTFAGRAARARRTSRSQASGPRESAERAREKSLSRAPFVPEEAREPTVPTAVRVCGFRAPDPGDVAEFRAEELSAGLGALLLFAETASRALGAPRLARGDGAGSSRARVWVPASYFEEAPSLSDDAGHEKLPLFLPRDVVEANGGGPRDASARRRADAERDGVSLGARGFHVLGAVAGATATGAAAAAAALAANVAQGALKNGGTRDAGAASALRDPGDPGVLARHRAELHRAVATLHRHAGATCVELEHVLGDVRAPEKWGPFASLAFLVTEASRRARDARDAKRRNRREAAEDETRLKSHAYETAKLGGARARSNPFFDDDDERLDDDDDDDGPAAASVPLAPVAEEETPETPRRRAEQKTRAGKQSLMTSAFGGFGSGGAKRRITRTRGLSRDCADARFLETSAFGDATVADLAADGWDLVEHPERAAERSRRAGVQSAKKSAAAPAMLPPPPSAPEDVEHWTRAMYVDARR